VGYLVGVGEGEFFWGFRVVVKGNLGGNWGNGWEKGTEMGSYVLEFRDGKEDGRVQRGIGGFRVTGRDFGSDSDGLDLWDGFDG
jgi:hypothetical protein